MPRKREYKFKGSGSPEEMLKRRIVFTPCKDKQSLHDWIQLFLDIDFPTVPVDVENGSVAPMDAIWDVYSHCLENKDYNYRRVLYISSRDSYKTLSAACLELLQVLHCRRNVVHLAAIEQQSQKSFEYLKGFLGKFILRDFQYSAKSRLVEILRFENKQTKENITDEDWSKLPTHQQEDYERVYNYIKLLVLTAQSTNSDHVPSMCVTGDSLMLTAEFGHMKVQQLFDRIAGEAATGNIKVLVKDDLKENIKVRCYNINKDSEEDKKILAASRRYASVLRIETEGPLSLKCTPEHPVYTKDRGYIAASELKEGDLISAPEEVKILRISQAGEEVVYDFTVEENHNFYANGILVSNSIDECDLIEGDRVRAYEESKMILGTDQRGNLPITLIISTRKTMTGLVQKEVDKAAKSGLIIHKWNILDITEPCPAERHLPELPKIPIWHSEDLSALSEDDYLNLSPDKKEKYVRSEGFQGCLSNCQLYGACLSRLATTQRPPSNMYKKIEVVQGLFREVTPENAIAQLLCRKPSRAGLIYPRLERNIHVKTASQIASMISGHPIEAFPNYTKQDLINLAIAQGLQFYSGMDFGYSHNFAVVTGIRDGNRIFVLDLIAAPELELAQKLEVCNHRIKHLEPVIFADPEDPASIKTFKRYGYHMRSMKKAKGSVIGGIDAVRIKLSPLNSDPQLFFLDQDEGMDLLFERLSRYHWKLDAAGDPTATPDEIQDDEVTALRYLVMSLFPPKGKPVSDTSRAFFEGKKKQVTSVQDEYAEFFQNIIEERTANAPPVLDEEGNPADLPSWWKIS